MLEHISLFLKQKIWCTFITDVVSRELAGLFFLGYAVLQLAAPLLCAR